MQADKKTKIRVSKPRVAATISGKFGKKPSLETEIIVKPKPKWAKTEHHFEIRVLLAVSNFIRGHFNRLSFTAALIAILIISWGTFKFLQADVSDLYFGSCLGDWQNPFNAEGLEQATADNPDSYTTDNSAVLEQTVGAIFCGSPEGEISENTDIKSITLHLSLAMKSNEVAPVVQINQSAVNEAGVLDQDLATSSEESSTTQNESPSDSTVTSPEPSPTSDVEPTPASSPDTIQQAPPSPEVAPAPVAEPPPAEPAPPASGEPGQAAPVSFFREFFNIAFAQEELAPAPPPTEPVPASEPPTAESPVPKATLTTEENLPAEIPASVPAENSPASATEATSDVDSPDATIPADVVTGSASSENEPFVEVLYSVDGVTWNSLGKIGRANADNLVYDVPVRSWEDVKKFQISIQGFRTIDRQPTVYLDSAWIEVEHNAAEVLPAEKEKENSPKKDFRADEEPVIEINLEATTTATSTEPTALGFFRRLARYVLPENVYAKSISKITTEVFNADGKKVDITPRVETKNGKTFLVFDKSRSFVPGKFHVNVTAVLDDGSVVFDNEDFTWGVLAINTNKSVFLRGEDAYLQMAVLTESGNTYCNTELTAPIELSVINVSRGTSRTYSTADGTIKKSQDCTGNNVTDTPDYSVHYRVQNPGTYKMILTRTDTGYSVTDSFEVVTAVPFELERVGATRINPFEAKYVMNFNLKANIDFKGEMSEFVPKGFEITKDSKVVVEPASDAKKITWSLDLKKNETISLKYEYQAPKLSPELFLLGPAQFVEASSSALVWKEARQWQLASDGVTNVQCHWRGTTNTDWGTKTNWSCALVPQNSCSGNGNCFWVAISNNTNPPVATTTAYTISGMIIGTSTASLGITGDIGITVENTGTAPTTIWLKGAAIVKGSGTLNLNPTSAITCLTTNESAATTTVNTGGTVTSTNANCTWDHNANVEIENSGTMSGLFSWALAGSLTNNAGSTWSMTGGTTTPDTNTPTITCNNTTRSSNKLWALKTTVSTTLAGNCYFGGAVVIPTATTLTTGSGTHELNWVNKVLQIAGTFTASAGNTIIYSGTSATTIATTTYIRLWLAPASGSPTYTVGDSSGGTLTTSSTTVGDGSNAVTMQVDTNDPSYTVATSTIAGSATMSASATGSFNVTGNWQNSGTFTSNSGTTTFSGTGAQNLYGTMTGSSAFGNLGFLGVGTKAFNSNASTTNFFSVNTSGAVTAPSGLLTVAGVFSSLGTFTHNSGTVYFTSTSGVALDSGGNSFNKAIFQGSGGTWTLVLDTFTSVATTTINAGTLNTSSSNLAATFANLDIEGGTFKANGSTVTLNGTSVGGTLFTLGSGTFTAGTSQVIMSPDANVNSTSGTFTDSNAFYDLKLSPTLTAARTYTFGSGAISVGDKLDIIPDSASAVGLTASMGAAITVTASTTLSRTTIASSTLDTTSGNYALTTSILDIKLNTQLKANGSTITVTGTGNAGQPFTRNSGQGTFIPDTSTVIYNGVGDITLATSTYYNLTLSPTLANTNIVYTTGSVSNETLVAKNLDLNPSGTANSLTLRLAANMARTTVLPDVTIRRSGSATSVLDQNTNTKQFYASTTVLWTGGTWDAASAERIYGTVGSPFTMAGGTFNANSSSFNYLGDGNITIASTTYDALSINAPLTTNRTYSTDGPVVTTTSFQHTASGGFDLKFLLGNTLTVGTSLTVSTVAGTTVTFDTASKTVTASSTTISTGGTLTANASTINITGNTGNVFSRNSGVGTFNPGTSAVVFTGDGNITFSTSTFYNLTFSPTLPGTFRAYTLAASGTTTVNGTFNMNPTSGANSGLTFNLLGPFVASSTTLNGSGGASTTLDTTTSNYTYWATSTTISTLGAIKQNGSKISIYKNFTLSTSTDPAILGFSAGTGTTTFGASWVATTTVSGTTTFNHVEFTNAGKGITFHRESSVSPVYTFAGNFLGTGASGAGNLINITSDSPGNQWKAHFNSTQSLITYASIYDCGCHTGTSNANVGDGTSVDNGNNDTCWNFGAAATAPSISGLSLNGGSNIILNEGTFKWATATMTVTDAEDCTTISSVSAKMFLASTSAGGTNCSANDDSCYLSLASTTAPGFSYCSATTTGNQCTGGGDTSAQYDCSFKLWYIAEPTDVGSVFAGSIWSVSATATDSGALTGTATNTVETVDILTLLAQSFTSPISYGSLDPGATSASDVVTYSTTTGNTKNNLWLAGTNMTSGGNSIAVGQEKYSLTAAQAYASMTALTTSEVDSTLANANPTSTTSPPAGAVYWKISIPNPQTIATYSGIATTSVTQGL